MSLNGCHLLFPPRVPRCHCEERSDVAIPPAKQARCAEICSPPMQTPNVIASEARQSRSRSQAGAPTHVHPSNEPTMSSRAKRGNPAAEAKAVCPRISTPQTNPLCHRERSAAILPPKPSRCADGCSPSSRFPLVLNLSKDSRNDRLKWVPVTNIPSLSRRQSLATIKTVGYKNRRLKKENSNSSPHAHPASHLPHSHTHKAHQ